MIKFAHAVPDDKLPLVNMNGLNDKAKLIIENRLKGVPCEPLLLSKPTHPDSPRQRIH